ncbi:hypothetical protein NCDO763_2120 [Lactococcus cremoris]|nr:hypothetical protein V4_2347 [Lactococcus cremoris]KZK36457.1 hypothetical protein N41_1838 [Lactococcus cremoris]KZK49268.1 hypothetical protein NCDO763_2120 [Lactococcus cremoris]
MTKCGFLSFSVNSLILFKILKDIQKEQERMKKSLKSP